jgi:hypothetical protein
MSKLYSVVSVFKNPAGSPQFRIIASYAAEKDARARLERIAREYVTSISAGVEYADILMATRKIADQICNNVAGVYCRYIDDLWASATAIHTGVGEFTHAGTCEPTRTIEIVVNKQIVESRWLLGTDRRIESNSPGYFALVNVDEPFPLSLPAPSVVPTSPMSLSAPSPPSSLIIPTIK